ncbi:MAG: polysaccharide biosynthesis/export family protein [Oleiphilaceae bacterium]|nr:polysaccharide biosynthesis/export family protein [Oleiphilaceae bacterium]
MHDKQPHGLFLALLLLMLSGCAASPYSSEEKVEKALARAQEPISEYRIGPTDALRISVWRNPELSEQVTVRPDGRISMPLLGDLVARGRTPQALSGVIEEKLAEYVRQPRVSVIVAQMGSHEFSHRVRVTGAVNNPLSQPWREGMTVMDMVLGAGGVNEFAAMNRAVLYRPIQTVENGQEEPRTEREVVAIPVRLDDILNKGRVETNYPLLPGDILSIPERRF